MNRRQSIVKRDQAAGRQSDANPERRARDHFLEASMSDGNDTVLNDLVEDKKAVSPEEPLINENLTEVTKVALTLLSDREQEILRMRYGLNDANREYTLQECGEKFQVTRERIRQIEERALIKLRARTILINFTISPNIKVVLFALCAATKKAQNAQASKKILLLSLRTPIAATPISNAPLLCCF